MDADHVVTRSDLSLACQHCGAEVRFAPMVSLRVDDWCAMARAFGREHEHCPPKEAPDA